MNKHPLQIGAVTYNEPGGMISPNTQSKGKSMKKYQFSIFDHISQARGVRIVHSAVF